MRTRAPPRLAAWLLEEFGSSARMEALIGDLAEQFASGRSPLWYWHQAGAALVLDLRRALRTHAPSFIAAVLLGYAVTELWRFGNSLAFSSVYRNLDTSRHGLTQDTLMRFLGLRGAQASLTVLTFLTGWLVTRVHRAHPRAVLAVFALSLVAQRLPGAAQLIARGLDGSLPWARVIPELVPLGLQSVLTLLVGLWMIRREGFSQMRLQVRLVAILTLALTLGSAFFYDLWKVGVLSYPPAVRFPVDAAEIASGAYLAVLFWRNFKEPRHDQIPHNPPGSDRSGEHRGGTRRRHAESAG